MTIIKPPTSLCSNPTNDKSIFLAGSIEMGTAEEWQTQVIEALKNYKAETFTVYNPRRDDWDSSWEQTYDNAQFYQQVNWELNALDKSDIVFMYFSPDTKSPISLLELGLYAKDKAMIVCCPDGFWRRGNIEIICEKFGIPFYSDLDKAIVGLYSLNKKVPNKLLLS